MIDSLQDKLSKLSRAVPYLRPEKRVRLGFYGYRHRRQRRRSALIARGAIAAALVIATIAAASGRLNY